MWRIWGAEGLLVAGSKYHPLDRRGQVGRGWPTRTQPSPRSHCRNLFLLARCQRRLPRTVAHQWKLQRTPSTVTLTPNQDHWWCSISGFRRRIEAGIHIFCPHNPANRGRWCSWSMDLHPLPQKQVMFCCNCVFRFVTTTMWVMIVDFDWATHTYERNCGSPGSYKPVDVAVYCQTLNQK
jgi:hypothetical protein